MSLLRHCSRPSVFLCAFALIAILSPSSAAQQPAAAPGKALTVERIYSQPSLSGRLTRGLVWTPDGKALSYFETKGSGKEAKTAGFLSPPTNSNPFCRWTHRDLPKPLALAVARLRNINGRPMARAFCFK